MDGIRVNFQATGASIDFNASVTDFDSTVQNAVTFVGQKSNSDKSRPNKGTSLHSEGVGGGLHNAGMFKHALRRLESEAKVFSVDTDSPNNTEELVKFSLVLDEWLPSAARIKVGALSSTGKEITTDYIVS